MAKYKKKLDADIRCPLEYGLTIFGGKWKSRIICVLSTQKTLRYSEIRTEMYNITDAVLAATLKELIADGIVNRRSFDEIPPRVEYPQKLYKALMNSQTVLTVWDDARLVGLIRVLDDSEMLAQIHYVLVHPEYQGRGIAGRKNIRILCILNLCLKTKITFLFMKSMDFMLWKTEQQCRYVILINFL